MKYYLQNIFDSSSRRLRKLWLWIKNGVSSELLSALFGALIGGLFTLAGVAYQFSKQSEVETAKTEQVERDKMIYIHHLIRDSGKYVKKFEEQSKDQVQYGDRFNLGGLPLPFRNDGSVNVLANRINHEEYFLASLNQLHNENFGDIFSLFNLLDLKIKESENRYNHEIELLVEEKGRVMNDVKGLFDEIEFYVDKHKGEKLSIQRRELYDNMVGTLTNIKNLKAQYPIDIFWTGNSYKIIYNTVVHLKKANNQEDKNLFYKAQEVLNRYLEYDRRYTSLSNWLSTDQAVITELMAEINKKAVPLNNYINKLNHG